MYFIRKKKWALLLAGLVLFGTMFTAQATLEVSEDYIFSVDSLAYKSVSDLMGNEEQRILVSSIILNAAGEIIGDLHSMFEELDPRSKVFLVASPLSSYSMDLLLFTIDHTWVFMVNTITAQILAGTMNYTIVPGAAEMVLSSFISDGSIEKYYQVSLTDIMKRMHPTFGVNPASTPRSYTSATLNQRMATRSGPGTKYTEEHTYPQETLIKLVETVTTHGTPWGMVEFKDKNGLKYRKYTGMKRINYSGTVAQGILEPYQTTILSQATAVYYGPGFDYVQRKSTVPAGTVLQVYDAENGFYLCDYKLGDDWIRAYFPTI